MSGHVRPEISPKARLALEAVEVFGQLAGLYEERRRQLAESVGLTIVQWQALEQVQHEHFMPSMFAAQRESSAAAVSKVLRQLVDKGLVVATLSDKDGRQRDYNVTERGRLLLDDVREQRQRAIAEIWMKLASDELEHFVGFGRKVAQKLDTWATSEAQQATRPDKKK
ncbi:MAG TPA: MarR family transcriptional regulator [Polyangiaceae bacterium]|nr:MarR family transcriptional regulator [Polyangiaceae bacterium]